MYYMYIEFITLYLQHLLCQEAKVKKIRKAVNVCGAIPVTMGKKLQLLLCWVPVGVCLFFCQLTALLLD